jgi:hypothetical protein
VNIQSNPGKHVGPSRYMEIGLTVLVTALLAVSIIGIAYVYGFNLNGNLLDNISAAVRAVGVDGGFFLGLYFSRRHWTREKQGWGDGLKALLAGIPWFVVAMIMAGVSWLSNTLFVNGSTTIITQAALDHAGITIIDAQQANWMIGGIPLLIILLYSIVPSQAETKRDTRTPEEIEQEAEREAARIRAQNKVAAARAEGAGQRLRTVVGGLVGEALNLEETRKRDERIKQMRIALETAGTSTAGMSDDEVEIQAAARGVWDQKRGEAIKPKVAARSNGATARLPETEADEETEEEEDQEGDTETSVTGPQVSWLDATAVAAFLEITKPTAKNWMQGDWTGPYRIQGCRNIKTKRGIVRKAPLKSVADVKKLLDAARHSKNGATVHTEVLTRDQLD